jgi:hypothetical protein
MLNEICYLFKRFLGNPPWSLTINPKKVTNSKKNQMSIMTKNKITKILLKNNDGKELLVIR